MFARRLDHLLRLGGGPGCVEPFLRVADRVATPVLVQVYNHFKGRSEPHPLRTFFPKGNVAKVQVQEGPLPPLPDDLTASVADGVRAALVRRFAAPAAAGQGLGGRGAEGLPRPVRPAVGQQVAADGGPGLPARPARRRTRSASSSGGRTAKRRTDIDLSAVLFAADWDRLGRPAVLEPAGARLGCCHSGDIVDAPRRGLRVHRPGHPGRCWIRGVRYVVMCLNSFTRQPYCDLPECFAGWMARQVPQSGEVFEARTVQDRIDLASDTTVSIPLVIDLEERRVVWADVALRSAGWVNNVHANRDNLARLARAVVGLDRPNLYDLFLMHAEARGKPAARDRADTVFSAHEGVTPFDTDKILSEFLA